MRLSTSSLRWTNGVADGEPLPTDRPASTVVGIAVLGVAVATVFAPGIAGLVPLGAVVSVLGNDYFLVSAVTLPIAVALARVVEARIRTGVTEARVPRVEESNPEPPGQEIDDALKSLSGIRLTGEHGQLHRRLRSAAVRVVASRNGCSKAEARKLIERGTWTDDDDVAEFLASEEPTPPSLARRVHDRFVGEDWFQRRFARTVSVLEERHAGTTGSEYRSGNDRRPRAEGFTGGTHAASGRRV